MELQLQHRSFQHSLLQIKAGPEEAETGGQVMAGVLERKMAMPSQSSLTPETGEGFQGCVLEKTARNGQQIGYGSQDEVYKEFIRRGPYAHPAWDSPGNSSCPSIPNAQGPLPLPKVSHSGPLMI